MTSYFTLWSGVSITDFEKVNVGYVSAGTNIKRNPKMYEKKSSLDMTGISEGLMT